jgi:hypothetical protein
LRLDIPATRAAHRQVARDMMIGFYAGLDIVSRPDGSGGSSPRD